MECVPLLWLQTHALVAGCVPVSDADSQNPAELIATVNQVMPFGRYKGARLIELPEPYLVWFAREGFPNGQLGRRMALMHEIKINGLERMLQPLIGADARRGDG